MPFQIAHLRGSQAVTISNQDHRAVAMTMPIALGGIDQPLDLALSEIATANCEVYRCWRAGIGCLFSHEKSLSCKDDWKDDSPFLHSLESVLFLSRKEVRKICRTIFCDFLSKDFSFFETGSGTRHGPPGRDRGLHRRSRKSLSIWDPFCGWGPLSTSGADSAWRA